MKFIDHAKSRRGFTLTEVLIAAFLSTAVVGAIFSLTITAIKSYYLESDYLEIGGQMRRLTDDLIERGTRADNMIILRDINALVEVAPFDPIALTGEGRGDCLMIYNRARDGTGAIIDFTCYYLAVTPATQGGNGRMISLWRADGVVPPSTVVTDPVAAVQTFPRRNARQVSGTIFEGTLPRSPAITGQVRAGIFTNSGSGSIGTRITVLVTLPSRYAQRATLPAAASSNVTFAITPRQ
jgi:hypothetical protein